LKTRSTTLFALTFLGKMKALGLLKFGISPNINPYEWIGARRDVLHRYEDFISRVIPRRSRIIYHRLDWGRITLGRTNNNRIRNERCLSGSLTKPELGDF
jgi:hypothetical protein